MKSFQDVKDDNTRYKMNEIYIHICQIICIYMSHKHLHIAKKKKKNCTQQKPKLHKTHNHKMLVSNER